MKYSFFSTSDFEKLKLLVNDAITKGWEPLGGISISSFEEGDSRNITVKTIYAQAIIKEEIEIKSE